MTGLRRRVLLRTIMYSLRFLLGLPEPALRLVAGRPIRMDGQRMSTTAQVLVRLSQLAPFDYPHQNGSLVQAREEMDRAATLAGGGCELFGGL
jgi:acetyl esterase